LTDKKIDSLARIRLFGIAMMPENILLSWSGGKDSARALYEIQQGGEYSVAALLSTVTEGYDRISMHGVRRELLERQAEFIGLPLEKIYIPKNSTNKEYESRMQAVLERYRSAGVVSVAFGDIFLEDLRQYREKNLGQLGMRGIFPIWK
jgi:diphthamide synthase (EF-2-diphthine--ammonia ligase)